eukprot:SAG31_NODE_19975_length_587_cov_0.870902_1_plen_84_part_10
METDPTRLISVVAYFTSPSEYEGGVLQVKTPTSGVGTFEVQSKQYEPGCVIAFPSKTLEHGVKPVTRGERRSLLLIVRASEQQS